MIISHASRFILFHNPKVVGMSIRSALVRYHDDPQVFRGIHQIGDLPFPLDLAHLRCCELKALFPELMARTADYRSVILVRNPYRRLPIRSRGDTPGSEPQPSSSLNPAFIVT